MSVRTRAAEAPGRIARRVQAAERVKSGAAQRAYARRKLRAEQLGLLPAAASSVRTAQFTARIPFVAAIIALLGCGLALTLLLTTRAAEDSYQLSDARTANQKLLDERAALQREVEAADSAPELAERARELGMIPAVDPARLLIAPDGTITVVGEPTPAQGAPAPPLNNPGVGRGERPVPVTALPGPAAPGALLPGAAPSPVPGSPAPAPAPPGAAGQPGAATPGAPGAPGTGAGAGDPAAPAVPGAPEAGAPAAPEPSVETLGVPIDGASGPAPAPPAPPQDGADAGAPPVGAGISAPAQDSAPGGGDTGSPSATAGPPASAQGGASEGADAVAPPAGAPSPGAPAPGEEGRR